MTIRSLLKLPKIAWPSPFKSTLGLGLAKLRVLVTFQNMKQWPATSDLWNVTCVLDPPLNACRVEMQWHGIGARVSHTVVFSVPVVFGAILEYLGHLSQHKSAGSALRSHELCVSGIQRVITIAPVVLQTRSRKLSRIHVVYNSLL